MNMKKIVIAILVILGLLVGFVMMSPSSRESFEKGREAGSQSSN